jgi:hypothetical protein
VFPEDGTMCPKRVASNRMYFNDILLTFSGLNESLVPCQIKSVLHYTRKSEHE